MKTDKHLTCSAWIDDCTIAAGTVDSKVLLIKNGECLLEISYFFPHLDISPCSSIAIQSSGMTLGLENGVIVFFAKSDDQYYYKKVHEIMLEESKVMSMAISPLEDYIVASLENSQIYKIALDSIVVIGTSK